MSNFQMYNGKVNISINFTISKCPFSNCPSFINENTRIKLSNPPLSNLTCLLAVVLFEFPRLHNSTFQFVKTFDTSTFQQFQILRFSDVKICSFKDVPICFLVLFELF